MNSIELKKFRDIDNCFIPKIYTSGSAGYDLHAISINPINPDSEFQTNYMDTLVINPNETVKIYTGLGIAVPKGYLIDIRSKSGLASRGLIVTNSPGTIDSDYRGEIIVLLTNITSNKIQVINYGDKIAQMVFLKYETPSFNIVDDFSDETERGTGGFGSTGV